jgi:hypothetical protein
MTTDKCVEKYEKVGSDVFSKVQVGSNAGRLVKGLFNQPFYDISKLQETIKNTLRERNRDIQEPFRLTPPSKCKV